VKLKVAELLSGAAPERVPNASILKEAAGLVWAAVNGIVKVVWARSRGAAVRQPVKMIVAVKAYARTFMLFLLILVRFC
jgi:hypothetical protein